MSPTTATTFYIVRHGQTLWNVARKIQGHTDNPLTEIGTEQAKLLAKELEHIHFDAIVSSDFIRAKQTAEIIASEKNISLILSAQLRERNMGTFEGKYLKTKKDYLDLSRWFAKTNNTKRRKIGVENDDEVMDRLLTFFRETAMQYQGKTLLLVTHGSLMKALLVHLGFAQHDQIPAGAVKNASYIELQTDGIDFSLVRVKDITVSG